MTRTDAYLEYAPWLKAPGTVKVINALEAWRPGCARFVGGCVRNTLLGAAVSDIDIATQLVPEETLQALKGAGIRAVPTGIEHGTVTAICDGEPFEITSLRRDIETDGRRAVVAFTEDWDEDAQRRDFRMNALYADADGRLYDPTGGLADIADRKVVFIGDAETRLREDHLRNLRFFRFSAWYGRGLDADGLAACTRQKDGLRQIAAERIWKELARLLDAPSPFDAISAMKQCGILEVFLPEVTYFTSFHTLQDIEREHNFQADGFTRLQSLLPRDPEIAHSVARRLRFSNAEADRLLDWARSDAVPAAEEEFKIWLYRSKVQTSVDIMLWSWAAGVPRSCGWSDALTFAQTWERPVFPLKGADLLAHGMAPGPDVGKALKELEALWIAQGFSFAALPDEIRDPHIRSALQSLRSDKPQS